MPSGKTHDKIAIISIIPVFVAGIFIFKFNFFGSLLLTLSMLFSQLMFGPDLDSKSSHYKRWGIIKWIWIPYRKIIKHRSSFSHGLIRGPVLRCIYLMSIISLFLIIAGYYIYINFDINLMSELLYLLKMAYIFFSSVKLHLTAIAAGIFIGAAIHTLTDKFVSFFGNLL